MSNYSFTALKFYSKLIPVQADSSKLMPQIILKQAYICNLLDTK
jgi:hypothetical protein